MLPADPRYLGATVTEEGTNFAIWTSGADAVELCLFDEVAGELVESRYSLSHRNGPVKDMVTEFMDRGFQNRIYDLIQQNFLSIRTHMNSLANCSTCLKFTDIKVKMDGAMAI
jgi:pullulanase/glycogen debranching enzyme